MNSTTQGKLTAQPRHHSRKTPKTPERDRGARHSGGHICRAHHSLSIAYCSASDTEAACAVRASMGESHGLRARTELRWGGEPGALYHMYVISTRVSRVVGENLRVV